MKTVLFCSYLYFEFIKKLTKLFLNKYAEFRISNF